MGPLTCGVLPGAKAGEPSRSCTQERGGASIGSSPLLVPAEVAAFPAEPAIDYRQRLQTTRHGWPLQTTWCVWVEPTGTIPPGQAPAQGPDQRWQAAVDWALDQWQRELPIVRVEDPQRAQVRIRRRRPPLGVGADGRTRASHGRAVLSLHRLDEGPSARVEPRVEVLISPGQRQEAIQATALHELGHAFGLWGHSDHPADAMAVAPGAKPVLTLSPRDQATLRWLYQQPTPMRSDP